MDIIVPIVILVIVAVFLAGWIRWSILKLLSKSGDPTSLVLLQNQVNSATGQTLDQMAVLQKNVRDELRQLNEQMSRSLTDTHKTVGDRLDAAARVFGDVKQQLGQMGETTRQMMEIGKDISRLQQTLTAPKLRGIWGELFLHDLLAQILPAETFQVQYRFKDGVIVDAAITLNAGIVPIDAKFPLENFKRIHEADNEDQRKAAKKQFVRDVKTHIDDIASKYIRVDEGTFDFALIYIPAENVYYEIMIRDQDEGGETSLFQYAIQRRVVPVSPNSLYAYLQTILLGLKGLRIESGARNILEQLMRLNKEWNLFAEEFRLVGQHLANSQKKFVDAEKRLTKVESKMEQIGGVAHELDVFPLEPYHPENADSRQIR